MELNGIVVAVLQALEDPTNPDAPINTKLKVVDYLFTGLFTAEMVFKIIVMGFVGYVVLLLCCIARVVIYLPSVCYGA